MIEMLGWHPIELYRNKQTSPNLNGLNENVNQNFFENDEGGLILIRHGNQIKIFLLQAGVILSF